MAQVAPGKIVGWLFLKSSSSITPRYDAQTWKTNKKLKNSKILENILLNINLMWYNQVVLYYYLFSQNSFVIYYHKAVACKCNLSSRTPVFRVLFVVLGFLHRNQLMFLYDDPND